MKKSHVAAGLGMAFLLYSMGFADFERSSSPQNGLKQAKREIVLRPLKIELDSGKGKEISNNRYRVPAIFKGGIENLGTNEYSSVTLSWFFRYRGEEKRGAYLIKDLKAKEYVNLNGKVISHITLPEFAGGVLQTEISLTDAVLKER